VPSLVQSYGSQEVDLPKLGPVYVHKYQLAVGSLPQEEAAQSFLAGSSNHEVGVRVWQMRGVQVLVKNILVNLVSRKTSLVDSLNNLLRRVDNLRPSRIGYCNIQKVPVVITSLVFKLDENIS